MKHQYVSNATGSSRMFKSDLLESLSKVHFSVPLFIFIPVIFYCAWIGLSGNMSIGYFCLWFAGGLVVWTGTEYLLHRFVFHFMPSSDWGKRIHFIFHGVHHDYPKDAKRLVMPPSASIPLATGFYFLFYLFIKTHEAHVSFFAGFITGYLVYDMMHFAMHHYNFKSNLMKRVKQHHMLHHYADDTKGFGVSSALWDNLLGSNFMQKDKEKAA
jgi:sterol desaturase/sphingolipid hydroxylase (fatty acid hydroxylase superfamily)